MPYDKSINNLDNLINEGIRDKEIQDGMVKAYINEGFLISEIKKDPSEIWEDASIYIYPYNEIENKLQTAQKGLDESYLPEPKKLESFDKIKRYIIYTIVILIVLDVILFFIGVADNFIEYLLYSFVIPITILFVFYYYISRRRNKLYDNYLDESEQFEDKKKIELGITDIENELNATISKIDNNIINEVIKPRIISIINLQLVRSYNTNLTMPMPKSLGEVFNLDYEISTKSKEKLNHLFRTLKGGSIGIAGPRGAGKTTLMNSFSGEHISQIEGQRALTVMTSAPIKYNARDFILHLFATVIKRFFYIKNISIKSDQEELESLENELPLVSFSRFINSILPKIALLLFFTGLTLLILFTYTLIELINSDLEPYLSTLMGVTPWDFLPYCIFFNISGYVVMYYIRWKRGYIERGYDLRELDNSLDSREIIMMKREYDYKKRQYEQKRNYEKMKREFAKMNEFESKKEFKKGTNIIENAQENLYKIRFQQSYSSGWSGSLQLPIIGGGVSATTSVSRKQLTLPEIIEDYRNFIERLTDEYVVIIGIDELDKLPSDEDAHRFLNDIKAIFRQENCFYLISVSESAKNSFERRGLQFRDAFDSSFDDIIEVNYLTYSEAENLIKRRVIGMPIPFIGFSYCMSGGLARDLIRKCRDLFEQTQKAPSNNNLSKICSTLIRNDLESKLNVVINTNKERTLRTDGKQLINEIYDIKKKLEQYRQQMSNESLWESCYILLNNIKPVPSIEKESKEVIEDIEKANKLRGELGTYIYYSLTQLEFFDENINVNNYEEIYIAAEKNKGLEELATARQIIGTSSSNSRRKITDFRESMKHMIPAFQNSHRIDTF
jgi:energy-coupling factor transporter ATP-binding protein EcfA2